MITSTAATSHNHTFIYDLAKNNEVRCRDESRRSSESVRRLESTNHFSSSSNADAEGATAAAVDTTRADSDFGLTLKINVKAPTFTLAGNIKVFLKQLGNF